MAAVVGQVDAQWSQTGSIAVYMPHNRGFFSAMTKLRGDSFYSKMSWNQIPPSLQQSRAQDAELTAHRGVRHTALGEGQEACRMHASREKLFSGTRVILGRHSDGHFGGECEDHLTMVDKDLDIEMRTSQILQITSENSQPLCWEASGPHEGQNKNIVRDSEDGKQNPGTESKNCRSDA